jgi:two-component system, NtrC family, response regulator HydG
MKNSILLVDDETQVLETSRLALLTCGIRDVLTCSDSRKVLDYIGQNPIRVIVMDIMMPYLSGKELLPQIKEEYPHIPVIMMTALGDLNNVVECMRMGAFDYLDKPVENLRLVTCVQRALEYYEVQQENATLKDHLLFQHLENPEIFSNILTHSDSMQKIFSYLESIAGTSRAVLITGDTGTGKELIAESVHQLSRREGEYVTVNVAGLDDTLFSDVLFGHKKGAFTGADSNRQGLLEQAQGGTIFLDEIGDLSMVSQVKLLRLLQEREFYPLGSDVKKRTDARFVVATSRDIRKMILDGDFRKDLYYRLQAHQVHIPPLRQRREDIPLLIKHFVSLACADLNKTQPVVPESLIKMLSRYSFPGNIRELESMVFNAVSQHPSTEEVLQDVSFRRDIELSSGESLEDKGEVSESLGLFQYTEGELPTIDECVDNLIAIALDRYEYNQTATAKALGITRQGLLARLKRKHIDPKS